LLNIDIRGHLLYT